MSIGQEKISYENQKELFANVFEGANFSVSKHLDFTASVMSQAYEGGFINVNGGLWGLGWRFRAIKLHINLKQARKI